MSIMKYWLWCLGHFRLHIALPFAILEPRMVGYIVPYTYEDVLGEVQKRKISRVSTCIEDLSFGREISITPIKQSYLLPQQTVLFSTHFFFVTAICIIITDFLLFFFSLFSLFFSSPISNCSEREASVMFANSWLYHYYSVQSKIQFGIPYEGPTRVPSTTTYFHHHSPTLQSPGLGNPYPTPHHHMAYGYHSPVGIPPHQGSPGIVGHHHHNGNGPPLNHHNNGDHYRPYAYRMDAQPVDFSSITSMPNQIEPRCGSANSLSDGSNQLGSPPSKRRAIARLEPLYIPEQQETTPTAISDTSLGDITTYGESHGSNGSDGGSTAVMTTVAALPRHRVHPKAMQIEAPDFMDQWNPSPPWSETTQKVPDIVQQELSPYLARTPPTPTSAPPTHTNGNGPAFSFDWMPEQFVPIMDYGGHGLGVHDGSATMHSSLPPPSIIPVQMQLQMSHWPATADNKLISMHSDKRPEEELIDQRRSHWMALYLSMYMFSSVSHWLN